MRDQSEREPPSANIEGAPTLIYEVWDWVDSDKYWEPLPPEECHYRFIGYRALSQRQVLKYAEFGYHVERSKGRDRCGTPPLFPRLGATGPGSKEWLD